MKNNLLLCALALLTAGMVLAEPTHYFKLSDFDGYVGQTVTFVRYLTSDKVISEEEIIARAIEELNLYSSFKFISNDLTYCKSWT